MPPSKKKQRQIIGWSELVDFPDWNIHGVEAKVDTGARTSAIHVEHLHRIDEGRVSFDVIVGKRRKKRSIPIEADVVKWALVRSSSGEQMERPFVKVHIQIGLINKEVEVTLVSRQNMMFRMLLGRKALEKDFLVDVGRRRVLSEQKKKVKETS